MSTMKEVIEAAKVVAAAHAKFLEASDALADAACFNRDYMLRKVLPVGATERRNSNKVFEYLKTELDEIGVHLREMARREEASAARAVLLARLNLTDSEKELLDIKKEGV